MEGHANPIKNYIAWINLIEGNITHCANLEFMRAQESYIHNFTTQVTILGLSLHSEREQKLLNKYILGSALGAAQRNTLRSRPRTVWSELVVMDK